MLWQEHRWRPITESPKGNVVKKDDSSRQLTSNCGKESYADAAPQQQQKSK